MIMGTVLTFFYDIIYSFHTWITVAY